jgi:hypothetical protein
MLSLDLWLVRAIVGNLPDKEEKNRKAVSSMECRQGWLTSLPSPHSNLGNLGK